MAIHLGRTFLKDGRLTGLGTESFALVVPPEARVRCYSTTLNGTVHDAVSYFASLYAQHITVSADTVGVATLIEEVAVSIVKTLVRHLEREISRGGDGTLVTIASCLVIDINAEAETDSQIEEYAGGSALDALDPGTQGA